MRLHRRRSMCIDEIRKYANWSRELKWRFNMKRKNSTVYRTFLICLMFLSMSALAQPPIPIEDPPLRIDLEGPIELRDPLLPSLEIKPPVVRYFQINNGASTTTTVEVTLNHKIASGQPGYILRHIPTHYRVSQSASFHGAEWKPYNNTLRYNLGGNEGEKTVYFQVAKISSLGNSTPITSNVVCDSIELRSRREFTIGGRDVFAMGQEYGFVSTARAGTDSTAKIDHNQWRGSWLALMCFGRTLEDPSQCDFTLFDGKELNEGWVFKSYNFLTTDCEGNDRGFAVNEKPVEGSRTIRFRIELRSDAHQGCEVIIPNLTLEGPGDKEWVDAFR